MVGMESENNPYHAPLDEPNDAGSMDLGAPNIGRAFKYSYCTSLLVAFSVVAIWLVLLFSSMRPDRRRTSSHSIASPYLKIQEPIALWVLAPSILNFI